MTISVDIADRLYDHSDEENAADAVARFQDEQGLDDEAIVAIWSDTTDPRRAGLEAAIFQAVDASGSAKRAQESVPGGVELLIEET